MKGYKGFSNDWTCLDMKYKVGETYTLNKSPVLCKIGFHFCKYPLDIFRFYPPLEQDLYSRKLDVRKFAKVEILGDIDGSTTDSIKNCTNKIKIESEIDYEDIIFDSIKCIEESIDNSITQVENKNEYYNRAILSNFYDHSKSVNTKINSISANIGNNSASFTSAICGSIAANTGDHSYSGNDIPSTYKKSSNISANTGIYSISLTTGHWSISSTTGDFSVSCSSSESISASTGNNSISHVEGIKSISANVGNDGISYSKGSRSISVTTGSNGISYNTGTGGIAISSGKNGIASVESQSDSSSVSISLGPSGMAKGSLGSWLVLAEWGINNYGNWYRKCVKSFLVDNGNVKENTLYTLEDGELKEVEE